MNAQIYSLMISHSLHKRNTLENFRYRFSCTNALEYAASHKSNLVFVCESPHAFPLCQQITVRKCEHCTKWSCNIIFKTP